MEQRWLENHPTVRAARQLLGKLLVRQTDQGRCSGWIVEVEAYLDQGDDASHSQCGPTPRNRSMFLEGGCFYVYQIHQQHCLNWVTCPAGIGSAVLIRALQPREGIDWMALRRGTSDPRRLTTGPGRLCQALAIDRTLDGLVASSGGSLWIESSAIQSQPGWNIRATPRIGISRSKDLQLRFFIDGNRYVSGCARDHSRPRHDILQESSESDSLPNGPSHSR
ncbi:MAG: DNA-3-methyladenine glycosylase [Pirellulaceae bacterium]|jgi:DNA-3-methyladenine glycosylase